jgi:hypothetical protein
MDLNPLFTSSTAFRPATTGGELALFASVGISLVHGWLVDPSSPEYAAVSRVGDYDSAMNLIVEADVLTRGLLVGDNVDQASGSSSQVAGPSHSNINLTDEEKQKVEDGEYDLIFLACRESDKCHSRRDPDVLGQYAFTTHVPWSVHPRFPPHATSPNLGAHVISIARLCHYGIRPTTSAPQTLRALPKLAPGGAVPARRGIV